jgi:2-polyprenyl-3-methyl-5-hydroxy-6-metoxy-1,4-benzoquinol methylase
MAMTKQAVSEEQTGPVVVAESQNLNRSCPACGNASRKRCQPWYTISEFEVLRCRDCGLTFINQAISGNSGFSAEYVGTDPIIILKSANDLKSLESKLKMAGLVNFQGKRLLDVGCGAGAFLEQAQQLGCKVAGLELGAALADWARKERKLEVETNSIEFVTSFPSASFDIVSMFGVIEHLGSPPSATQECARLLRSGGLLVVQTPTEDGLIRRIGHILYRGSGGLVRFQVNQFYQTGGGHTICFNRRSLTNLLTRSGFKILAIDPSTYGLRLLLMRFENLPFGKRLVYGIGTSIVFALGRILRCSNHMTVYALKV